MNTYEFSTFLASNYLNEDEIDCTKVNAIQNLNFSTAIETCNQELTEVSDNYPAGFTVGEKAHSEFIFQESYFEQRSIEHPSAGDLDLAFDKASCIQSKPEKNAKSQLIFTVTKVNVKKLAIKAKIIYLKSFFLKSLRNKQTTYFEFVKGKLFKDKQTYSKEHIDLFLNSNIKRFILESFPQILSTKEKTFGLNLLCSDLRVGKAALKDDNTFLDFYQKSEINKRFSEEQSISKWKLHRKIPLNELLEGVYSRTISIAVIKERTRKTKEKKEKKLLEKQAELKLIKGLQASNTFFTHFQKV